MQSSRRPVSYTHLDVYKRQIHKPALSRRQDPIPRTRPILLLPAERPASAASGYVVVAMNAVLSPPLRTCYADFNFSSSRRRSVIAAKATLGLPIKRTNKPSRHGDCRYLSRSEAGRISICQNEGGLAIGWPKVVVPKPSARTKSCLLYTSRCV